ncbi:hypothetical protein [Microbacterium sp.]|uniref:hypothetical protein n=1 Tax=Microbacterium sp. TaxID=51671 RepID=UPI0039E51AC3
MRAEYQAFKERLQAHPRLSNKVYDVVRTIEATGALVRENYVIAFPSLPTDLNDHRYRSAQRVSSRRVLSFDVRVVATTADAFLRLAEDVMGQLIDHVLDVEGRECDRITMATDHVEEGTGQYDRTSRLFFVDMTFEFVSRPKE